MEKGCNIHKYRAILKLSCNQSDDRSEKLIQKKKLGFEPLREVSLQCRSSLEGSEAVKQIMWNV